MNISGQSGRRNILDPFCEESFFVTLLIVCLLFIPSAVLYFEVKVNVSITGDCEAEQILSTWVCLLK